MEHRKGLVGEESHIRRDRESNEGDCGDRIYFYKSPISQLIHLPKRLCNMQEIIAAVTATLCPLNSACVTSITTTDPKVMTKTEANHPKLGARL